MKKRIQKLRHHAKFGNIAKAEQEFDQIWKLQSERTDYGRLQFEDIVWECIRCIIRGCTRRLRVRAPKAKNADTIQNLVGFANRLFEGGKSNFPESTNNNKFRSKFVDAVAAWSLHVPNPNFSSLSLSLSHCNDDMQNDA
jgi:hypothetical protein